MREQHGRIMEENAGTRFGNYNLVKRIDVGGMGEVYLAHQLTAFGRPVAIKIIRSDLVHDITARARFLREAEVSAHLKHEHILPLFDFGEVEGRLFLVTPYIEGGTLAKLLKDGGTITLQEAHTFFVALVQAIAYIHRRGVIHRDLKPTNIMLDREDGEVYVRLIDFGIASLQGQSASPPLTTAGHEMGTVAFMAPERLSGIAAPSNDIFSLGVMLHQMLTGRMPTASPSPTSAAPRLPEPLAQVVRRCIAANPAERYATAEELLKSFEQAYQQMMQPTPKSPLPAPIPSRPAQNPATPIPERVALAHSGEMPALTPAARPVRFAPEDYSAPTTAFQPLPQLRPTPTSRPAPPQRQVGSRKKSPALVVASTASILVLLLLAGMLYYGYQTVIAASVSVNFTPRSQVISQVFSFKANPKATAVDFSQAIVPARVFTLPQTAHQTGSTTGQANCVFAGLGCQQAVSPDDVNNLAAQMQPGLESGISQALQNKISGARGTQIGNVQFSIPTITSDPSVGTVSKTVAVALTENGSVGYISNADVASLMHQMLLAVAGQGYQLVEATVKIGTAAIQGVDSASGVSTMQVAAGAVARYQFTQAQLQTLSAGLKGKSLREAEAFLKNQPGIDPTSVRIHFSNGSGQSMPSDPQHIKLIPLGLANQSSIPLTPVTGITPTDASTPPIDTPTVTSSPSPTATATDNGGGG